MPKLEQMLYAVEVKKSRKTAEVTASDGKKYSCAILYDEGICKDSINCFPKISAREKSDVQREAEGFLRNCGTIPDIKRINHERRILEGFRFPQWDDGFTVPLYITEYSIEYYRILKKTSRR